MTHTTDIEYTWWCVPCQRLITGTTEDQRTQYIQTHLNNHQTAA